MRALFFISLLGVSWVFLAVFFIALGSFIAEVLL